MNISAKRNSGLALVVICLLGIVGLWQLTRSGDDHEQRVFAVMCDEIEHWNRWAEFRQPLTKVLEEHADDVYAASCQSAAKQSAASTFNEQRYRESLYALMQQWLLSNGYDAAASELRVYGSAQSELHAAAGPSR